MGGQEGGAGMLRALAGALAALLSLSQRVADEDEWMNR